jgi:D-alanyl-lipoteichoic acid acyltransferase DltB (MBOAT superfamily)
LLNEAVILITDPFISVTQLAYLVDCQRGIVDRAHHSLMDYILFVTFFPHLGGADPAPCRFDAAV